MMVLGLLGAGVGFWREASAEQLGSPLMQDIACTTDRLEMWHDFRVRLLANAAAGFPPDHELFVVAERLSDRPFRNGEGSALTQLMQHNTSWLLNEVCIHGWAAATYVSGWGFSVQDDFEQAWRRFNTALRITKFLAHPVIGEAWPFSIYDLQIAAHHSTMSFYFPDARHAIHPFRPKFVAVEESVHLREHLPLVWPKFGECTGATGDHPTRIEVLWLAKHHSPLIDLNAVLDVYFSKRTGVAATVFPNLVSEYCELQKVRDRYCSGKYHASLAHVLRYSSWVSKISSKECDGEKQWCGLIDMHNDFDAVEFEFQETLRELESHVDLFVCGHPLFWCKLFQSSNKPILGLHDMGYQMFVPEEVRTSWRDDFERLFFNSPQNALVAQGPFEAFSLHWLLGRKVPFVSRASLPNQNVRLRRDRSILLSVGPDNRYMRLIQSCAAVYPGFPYELVIWGGEAIENLAMDTPQLPRDASNDDLLSFFGYVLQPYDVTNTKLNEFYNACRPLFVHRELWRTTMSWAQANKEFHGNNGELSCSERDLFWNQDNLNAFMAALPWSDPWAVMDSPHNFGCFHGPLPFTPFPSKEWESSPVGMTFWAQFSDWWLLPHLQRYNSIADLLHIISKTPEDAWTKVSTDMAEHLRVHSFEVVKFWRAIVLDVIRGQGHQWMPK